MEAMKQYKGAWKPLCGARSGIPETYVDETDETMSIAKRQSPRNLDAIFTAGSEQSGAVQYKPSVSECLQRRRRRACESPNPRIAPAYRPRDGWAPDPAEATPG